jgi:seryl-tRNA synthetase
MAKFKSIPEWLKTNPSEEEKNRVLLLIQRGETNKTRRELYQLEGYLRKLQATVNSLSKLNIPVSQDLKEPIIETKKKIEELKKDLPEVVKREKKEKKEEVPQTQE